MNRLALGAFAALIAALVLAASPPGASAQGFRWFDESPRTERVYRERRVYEDEDPNFRKRLRYYSRDAVARREGARERNVEVEAERSPPNFFQRLFGARSSDDLRTVDPGAVEVRPRARKPRRRPPPAIAAIPGAVAPGVLQPPGAPPVPGEPAVVAAPVQPTTFVAVVGDSVADGLAEGLQEGFADAPEVAIKRLTKPNAGLVRQDYFDFVAEAEKALDAGPINYAVFELGVNDRQPFVDMRREAPLSDEWRKRYAARIDALLTPFKERKIPIYWVGLAPSGSGRATADHTAINTIAKERVEAADGTYVDVWEGFVDEDGRYAEFGPQLDGQVGRLRLDDGVHFSKAGARKLAHYAEQEIRKVFQPKPATPDAVAALPAEGGVEAARPDGPAAEKPRPISSPVMVLTAPRRAPNGLLSAATPTTIPARDASASAARVLVNGETVDADPGRMDDHRWPGAGPAKLDQARPVDGKAEDGGPADSGAAAMVDPRPLADQKPLGRAP